MVDPLPPSMIQASATSIQLYWNPVKFCGISAPAMLDSVHYTIEVCEGVEWRESTLSKYMNDMTATDYRPVFTGKNISEVIIGPLKPAMWYHFRLVVDYLGLKVMSESFTAHTVRCPPTPPPQPKITIVPVRNSFDLNSDIPVRFEVLISWLPSQSNGSEIERYQLHIKRFDEQGNLLMDDPPFLKKKQESNANHPQKAISKMIKINKSANQWVGSPGRNEVEIRNSICVKTGQRSVSPPDTRHSHSRSKFSPPPSPGNTHNFFMSPNNSMEMKRSTGNSQTAWRIIYDNLNRNFKLGSPNTTDAVWWVRVRAKNSDGWSPFSEVKIMNQISYPSLFPHVSPAPRNNTRASAESKESEQQQRSSSEAKNASTPTQKTKIDFETQESLHWGSKSHDSADSQTSVPSIPVEFRTSAQRPVTRGKPLMMGLESANRPPRPDSKQRPRELQLPDISPQRK